MYLVELQFVLLLTRDDGVQNSEFDSIYFLSSMWTDFFTQYSSDKYDLHVLILNMENLKFMIQILAEDINLASDQRYNLWFPL